MSFFWNSERRRNAGPAVAVVMGMAAIGLIALAGCSKDSDQGATAPTSSAAAPAAAGGGDGKALVASAGCVGCHAINGAGGGRAPDLSHIGSDPAHTAQWIADYAKDPKSKDPGSHMPPQGGRVSDADLLAIGTYLASLK